MIKTILITLFFILNLHAESTSANINNYLSNSITNNDLSTISDVSKNKHKASKNIYKTNTFPIENYSNANNLVHTLDFRKYIISKLPNLKSMYGIDNDTSIAEHYLTFLGGPPNNVIKLNKNTYFVSACRYQSCGEKASYIKNDESELFGMISYFNGNRSFIENGLLTIFYKNEQAKKQLLNFMINWKNEISNDIDVKYYKIN